MWLRHRVAVAERGADQLERKVQLISREVVERRKSVERSRAVWEATSNEAAGWMVRAGFVGGVDAVKQAWTRPKDVEVTWVATMGVRHPDGATIGLSELPDVAMSAATFQTRRAFDVALRAAVELSAGESAVALLESDLRTTRRRARVLRRHWLPQLQSQLHDLELALEQAEQEDQARLRRNAS